MLYISEKNKIVVDVTKAPYFADPTGKTDSTAAICRAIDDIVVRDIEGVQQMRQKLLEDPRDNFRIGFENRKTGFRPSFSRRIRLRRVFSIFRAVLTSFRTR